MGESGARLNSTYRAQWFDPRNGSWHNAGSAAVRSNQIGIIELPDLPGDTDWGLRLIYENAGAPTAQDRRPPLADFKAIASFR
jgi:hypothetical protein